MRTALVGAGYIAAFHAEAARRAGADLVAVCDPRAEVGQELARRFDVAHWYHDVSTMLERESPDVVHVLTPPDRHLDVALEVLAAGCDVFMEKPAVVRSTDGETLLASVQSSGRRIGVSHNFLFLPAVERFLADVRAGLFGPMSVVEVLWAQALPQFRQRTGRRPWLLSSPDHLIHETGPHVFSLIALLCGRALQVDAQAFDRDATEDGWSAYRKWQVRVEAEGSLATASFDFAEGPPVSTVRARGFAGSAVVDLGRNTYTRRIRSRFGTDVDQLISATLPELGAVAESARSFARLTAGKLGMGSGQGVYADSIARAVRTFYASESEDERLSLGLALECTRVSELAAAAIPDAPTASRSPAPTSRSAPRSTPESKSDTLVVGASGFIGSHLVRHLVADGHEVRVMARDPERLSGFVREHAHVVRGDVTDVTSVRSALRGIASVHYLARSSGTTWPELESSDVQPALSFAKACWELGVPRLVYASSIAIYDAARRAGVITEQTAPSRSMARAAPYSRSKLAIEDGLGALHESGLDVVVVRPGVVLGAGSSPVHWGVACWVSPTVCTYWGDGRSPLPIVLVEDVCAGMAAAGELPGIGGQSFNLSATPSVSARQYIAELERTSGVHIRAHPMPPSRRYAQQLGKWMIKRAGGDRTSLRPSYADCEGRSLAAHFDSSAARTVLGWKPEDRDDEIVTRGITLPAREFYGAGPTRTGRFTWSDPRSPTSGLVVADEPSVS